MIGVQKRITMKLILASWNVFQFACLVFFSKFYPVLLEIEQDSITQIISFFPLKFVSQEPIIRE